MEYTQKITLKDGEKAFLTCFAYKIESVAYHKDPIDKKGVVEIKIKSKNDRRRIVLHLI